MNSIHILFVALLLPVCGLAHSQHELKTLDQLLRAQIPANEIKKMSVTGTVIDFWGDSPDIIAVAASGSTSQLDQMLDLASKFSVKPMPHSRPGTGLVLQFRVFTDGGNTIEFSILGKNIVSIKGSDGDHQMVYATPKASHQEDLMLVLTKTLISRADNQAIRWNGI